MPKRLAEIVGIAMVLITATIIAVQFLNRGRFPPRSIFLLKIGCLWVVYTVAFDFIFFHYVVGMTWGEVLENYNLASGHLFPIGLLLTIFVPVAALRLVEGCKVDA